MRQYLALLESIEQGARDAASRGLSAEEGARRWRPPPSLGEWVRFSDNYFTVAFRAWARELGG